MNAGEVVTLLGRNGAGKTTTLKSIMGIIGKRTGSVRFNGRGDRSARTSDKIARLGIALCPEERGIFASLDVRENLMLPPVVRPGGLSLEQIFELFPNLKERLKSQGTKLSGGEQQMLAIARILRTGASFLMLDEPTEGLAPVIIQQIGHTIAQLKKRASPSCWSSRISVSPRRWRIAITSSSTARSSMASPTPISPATWTSCTPISASERAAGKCAHETILGIRMQALFAQLLVGLINGSFYALLSLGLAVIFGMLNIINFTHGALYMMGAFCAYFLLNLAGIGYWWALLIAPLVVGIFGMILERTMLQWLSGLDHLYGLLLTFGLALIIQGVFQNYSARPACPTRSRRSSRAAAISASCTCRTIAAGSWCSRWSSASPPGT